jgi:carboxymethylenebutenolidase
LPFLAGTRLGADVVAGFHATHIHKHLDEVAKARGAISLHYGGADPLVPIAQVTAVKSALAANPRAEVEVYEGAQHGFSFKGRPSYHELAATRSSARARQLIEGLK